MNENITEKFNKLRYILIRKLLKKCMSENLFYSPPPRQQFWGENINLQLKCFMFDQ
jgi:hypothetical protein